MEDGNRHHGIPKVSRNNNNSRKILYVQYSTMDTVQCTFKLVVVLVYSVQCTVTVEYVYSISYYIILYYIIYYITLHYITFILPRFYIQRQCGFEPIAKVGIQH